MIWHGTNEVPEDGSEVLIKWRNGKETFEYINATFYRDGGSCEPDNSCVFESGFCIRLHEVEKWAYIADIEKLK